MSESLAAELLRALSPKTTEAGYLMAPPEGTVFGARPEDELELVSKIGEGSFGTVWRAVHRPSHAFVAVKRVRLDGTDTDAASPDAASSSALKESAAMEQLTHENIVRFYAQYRFADGRHHCTFLFLFPLRGRMTRWRGMGWGMVTGTDAGRSCGL